MVIMAFTFGALVAAGMPVITALVGLIVGLGLVGLLGHVVSIPNVAPTLATMVGLGVGIDYALFIVFRHRDQLHRGMAADESIALAMATSGSAVVFAGATVIVALLALLVARVPLLGAMGYAAALTVGIAVLTAITLLPAMLAILGAPHRRAAAARAAQLHPGSLGRQRLGALGGLRHAPSVGDAHRLPARAGAAHRAHAHAAPRPGGRGRDAHLDVPAARVRPHLGGARAGGQRPPRGGRRVRPGGRAERRVHGQEGRGGGSEGAARGREPSASRRGPRRWSAAATS